MSEAKEILETKLDELLHIDISLTEDLKNSNTRISKELFEILKLYKGNALEFENQFMKIEILIK